MTFSHTKPWDFPNTKGSGFCERLQKRILTWIWIYLLMSNNCLISRSLLCKKEKKIVEFSNISIR